jgi:hypothetical protein
MVVSENDRRSARDDGGPENGPRLKACDAMLRSNRDDVRPGDPVEAVDEERREVLSVGKTQKRVKRPRRLIGMLKGRLG